MNLEQMNNAVNTLTKSTGFTATATAIGGRNGHTETSDGVIKADLSVPKEMGGPGRPGTATPEHLFAAGYAACFGGSLDFVAKHRAQVTRGRAGAVHSASARAREVTRKSRCAT